VNYIPIVGFVYAAVRVMWAQHQYVNHAMSIDEEWSYFDQFNVAFVVTMCFLLVARLALSVIGRSRAMIEK